MITNLICVITIALATNTFERFPQHMVAASPPEGSNPFQAVFYHKWEPDVNPTNKFIVQSVVQTTTYTFDLGGVLKSFSESKEIKITETALTKGEPTWKPFATNDVFWIDQNGRVNQSNGIDWRMSTNWPNQIIHGPNPSWEIPK